MAIPLPTACRICGTPIELAAANYPQSFRLTIDDDGELVSLEASGVLPICAGCRAAAVQAALGKDAD
jgi:hypothetical protein